MERDITDKEKEIILNLGGMEYPAKKCADILDWPVDEVVELSENEESSFFKIYQKGKTRAEYLIDLKLFEQAQAGDIKSLEKLNNRKRNRK